MELCIYTVLLIIIIYVFLLYSVAYLSYINPERLNLRQQLYKKKTNSIYIKDIMLYEQGKELGEIDGKENALKDVEIKQYNAYNKEYDNDNPSELWKFGYKRAFYLSYSKTFDSKITSITEDYNTGLKIGIEDGIEKGIKDGEIFAQYIINKDNLVSSIIELPKINPEDISEYSLLGKQVGVSRGYFENIGKSFFSKLNIEIQEELYIFMGDEKYMTGLINGFITGYNKGNMDSNETEETVIEQITDFVITNGGKKSAKNPSFIAIPNYIMSNSLESNGYEVGHEIGYDSSYIKT